MSNRINKDLIWCAARCAPIALCLALGACASSGDSGFLLLADPGKYQYYNCEQIAAARKSVAGRQKELKELIDKAEQGAGGVLVGAIAYRSDYVAANQNLRTIEATAHDKNCPPPAPTPVQHSGSAISR